MININECRNTVLFLLAKNNYGYLSPEEFNSYAQLAQMSIFEELFYLDARDSIKKNNHLTNSQYADLKKIREEQIDLYSQFSTPSNFTYNNTTKLWSYTGTDLYRAISTSLVHTSSGKKVDVELMLKTDLNKTINSNVNPPTLDFPIGYRIEDDFKVYPDNPSGYYVELLYLRKPKSPKWTYVNVGGNPMFNASATDLQHVDLHISLYEKFIVKVCSYAGLALREAQVTEASAQQEVNLTQKQS